MMKASFGELAAEMVKLQAKKNADYDNAFQKSMDEFGLVVAAVRIGDKFNRFKSLMKSPARVKSESIEDTLVDLSAYALMTVEWLKNKENGNTD